MRYVVGLAIVAALGVFFAINCGDAGGERGPATNDEFNEMLDGLGFNTDIGGPVDPFGEPLDVGYHPLGSRYAAFNPRSELYIAGLALESGSEHLFDDASKEYDPIAFTVKTDTTWIDAQYKNGIGADIDGDGLDEFVIVYYAAGSGALKYIILDPAEDSVREGEIDPSANNENLDALVQPAMTAGDFDGDDEDEVFVGFAQLYVLDDLGDEPSISSKAYTDQNSLFVAAGNLDLDPEDELVVTHTVTAGGTVTGKYEIYDGSLTSPAQQGDLRFSANNQSIATMTT